MTPDLVAELMRQLMKEAMILAAPMLIAAALLSFVLSLVQTLTSLQEQSLTTVPRLAAVVMIMLVACPGFWSRMAAYTIAAVHATFTVIWARLAKAYVQRRIDARLDELSQRDDAGSGAGERDGGLCPVLLLDRAASRTKAVFVGAVAFLLAPLVAALPNAQAQISFSALMGELAVGLVYGLTLTLLNEMMLFAGQIVGAAIQLLDGQSAGPDLVDPDAAAGRSVSVDGHAGGDSAGPGPHSAGLDGAQFPCGAPGQLTPSLRRRRWRLSVRPAASFWPPWNWPRRCWPRPCWSRLRSLCWANSARSCRS